MVFIIILHIIIDGLTLLLSDLDITIKETPFYFLIKGVTLVVTYSVGAYLTAYFVLKNLLKDHLELRLRIFLRIFIIVVIAFFLHLIANLSLTLVLLNLSNVPEWLIGTIDYSALSISEVASISFFRNLAAIPGYIIHAIIFPAYFYIFSQNAKVFESLSLCLYSLGTWVVWLSSFLLLSGFITKIIEHSTPGFVYWLAFMTSTLLTWYFYSGIFLTTQRISSNGRGNQGAL